MFFYSRNSWKYNYAVSCIRVSLFPGLNSIQKDRVATDLTSRKRICIFPEFRLQMNTMCTVQKHGGQHSCCSVNAVQCTGSVHVRRDKEMIQCAFQDVSCSIPVYLFNILITVPAMALHILLFSAHHSADTDSADHCQTVPFC